MWVIPPTRRFVGGGGYYGVLYSTEYLVIVFGSARDDKDLPHSGTRYLPALRGS